MHCVPRRSQGTSALSRCTGAGQGAEAKYIGNLRQKAFRSRGRAGGPHVKPFGLHRFCL